MDFRSPTPPAWREDACRGPDPEARSRAVLGFLAGGILVYAAAVFALAGYGAYRLFVR